MRAEINARPNGARFFRADLHIHSCVGSHDVADKTCTPENIVATAKKEGLDIIAIADHNEITAVDAADAAALKAGMMLVPAVELSTPEGHLLCYLPTIDALKKFHGRLSIVDRGRKAIGAKRPCSHASTILANWAVLPSSRMSTAATASRRTTPAAGRTKKTSCVILLYLAWS